MPFSIDFDCHSNNTLALPCECVMMLILVMMLFHCPRKHLNPSASQIIDRNSTSHLGREEQAELLAVLDRYPECFSDVPGLMGVVARSVPLVLGFGPKCLHAYRVRERLKPVVAVHSYCGRKKSGNISTVTDCLSHLY